MSDAAQKFKLEIQVVSLPLHGWAEVHHDCVYKPGPYKNGKPKPTFDGELRAILNAKCSQCTPREFRAGGSEVAIYKHVSGFLNH